MPKLDQIKPGDVLSYWFDTEAMGAQLNYARVLKVCAKKLKVQGERGEIGYKYPWFFNRVESVSTVARLREEGLNV